MKERKLTVLLAVVVAVFLVLYLVIYQVRINQVVVHYRLGRVLKVVNARGRQAGWHFKWPYPIDTLRRFDRRVQVFEGKLAETATSDPVNVIPRVYVAWRIANADEFVRALGREESVAVEAVVNRLKDIANTGISSSIGRYPFSALVSTNPKELKLAEIEKEANEYLSKRAMDQYHVEIVDFGIKRIALPQDVTKKVFDRMKKERERVRDDFRARGDAEAKKIVARAEMKREEILAQARAKAKETIAEGEVKAAEFLPVFAQNRELHEFLIKLDAMAQVSKDAEKDQNKPVFILDTKTNPYSILETGPDLKKSDEKK